MNPIVLSDLFSKEFNQNLCDRLQRSAEWRLCLDEHYRPGMDPDRFSDTGFVYYTYTQDRDWHSLAQQDPARGWFNTQAEHILHTVLTALGTDTAHIQRVMWNYYNRSSQGIPHQDYDQPGLWSMVYNLADTDGGTEIGDQFIKGHAGTAVIFPSELWHRGLGPQQQPRRFVLNCIFSADLSDK